MTPLIVIGALGRMGRAISECALSHHAVIKAGVVKDASVATPHSFPLYADLAHALHEHSEEKPVLLDFSTASLCAHHIELAIKHACPMLIGTTGHLESQQKLFEQASAHIPLLVAPNTSLMAIVMKHLVRLTSAALPHADKGILEIHHSHKKDAPSGTARDLAKVMGPTTAVQSLRMGEIIGEHTAYFTSNYERLEITHRASDRRVFAQGALYAAQFIFQHNPGLYDMNDVLNLNLTVQKDHKI